MLLLAVFIAMNVYLLLFETAFLVVVFAVAFIKLYMEVNISNNTKGVGGRGIHEADVLIIKLIKMVHSYS